MCVVDFLLSSGTVLTIHGVGNSMEMEQDFPEDGMNTSPVYSCISVPSPCPPATIKRAVETSPSIRN